MKSRVKHLKLGDILEKKIDEEFYRIHVVFCHPNYSFLVRAYRGGKSIEDAELLFDKVPVISVKWYESGWSFVGRSIEKGVTLGPILDSQGLLNVEWQYVPPGEDYRIRIPL